MTGTRAAATTARHEIANLLHTYTEAADRKDVDAAVRVLGGARVRFPSDGFDTPAGAEAFFGRLWDFPGRHRHDVSNLVVLPGQDATGTWEARAHYTRWLLDPSPRVHTFGAYTLLVAETDWTVRSLTVTRTWTEDGG
ncbi:nuclear transport factor 2 family protein [Streptomyces sp. NPDC088812]|uniref:nuclear transport factor 2 family protein n=1 Tax=Streptomyces sp. NPDC088812 TaxID=3365905 RepID=UPI0037FCEF53